MRFDLLTYLVPFAVGTMLFLPPTLFGEDRSKMVEPLVHAHAHNDYEHDRPLLDALEQGFTNIEADIFLIEDEILVAHNLVDVSKERTLEKLYLQPLHRLVQKNGGRVYPDGPSVTLLIDFKLNGAATYRVLVPLLQKYADMISRTTDEQFAENAVTVIVSGDRPIKEIAASNPRFVGIDGRLSDLVSDESPSMLPLISDNWTKHFTYLGEGEFSSEERKKLNEIISKAHSKNRRVRFWATPESELLWKELRAADVDLIGTDDLSRLAKFLRD